MALTREQLNYDFTNKTLDKLEKIGIVIVDIIFEPIYNEAIMDDPVFILSDERRMKYSDILMMVKEEQ